MINEIRCNKESFKTIKFNPSFNIILADRSEISTKKDTRNGLGKTSLIEIIHFCLGGKKENTVLAKEELKGWEFTLDITIAGKRYSFTRNTGQMINKIFIEGDYSDWFIEPEFDRNIRKRYLKAKDFNKVLGTLLFGIKPSFYEKKYKPTFRSLISYFVRRNGRSGGFLVPFKHHTKQQEWDIQVNNAFLLGLPWEYAVEWQQLKDRKKVLEQLKKAAEEGMLEGIIGSLGKLEAKSIRLAKQVEEEAKQLSTFRIHPQYKSLEQETNNLTINIQKLVNETTVDEGLLQLYRQSIEEEVEAKPEEIIAVYKEAGVIFPNMVKKRLDDVLKFHRRIIENRRSFLGNEILQLEQTINQRNEQIKNLSEKRESIMKILQSYGALDEYTKLQERHQKHVAELEDIKKRLENLRKFEQGKSSLKIELEMLYQKAISDLKDRATQKNKIILQYNENSKALYNAPGTLSIDITESGYKFKVEIERSGSTGIRKMEIFCYDLLLAQIWAEQSRENFLIHDSHLFDGVDERQKALALELAARESEKRGFQYICSMNTNDLPLKDFSEGFDIYKYEIIRFTDATPDGGLFGIRF
ncbi:MAG: ABC-three component system protein [Candidatus Heimdallarchaeaceae archaeon]